MSTPVQTPALSVPVLAYHEIAPFPGRRPERPGLLVHPASFRRQLALLRGLGYGSLRLADLGAALASGRPLPRRAVVLTFDDGYQGTCQWALPLLRRYGFSATFFLIAEDFAAGHEAVPARAYPVLSHAQVRAMLAAGMEIGSHSISHPRLSELAAGEAQQQIVASKALLEAAFGTTIESFCYPYGDHTPQLAELVAAAGYRCAVTTRFGRQHRASEQFTLKRIPVGAAQSLAEFAYRLLRARESKVVLQ